MPINASYEFLKLQKEFTCANTKEEKIKILGMMLRESPKHKGSENLNAQLRRRLSKLKKELDKERHSKKGKGKKSSIRKEGDFQIVLVGLPNSGKSYILNKLTNASPKIASYPFTTTKPEQGMWLYGGCEIQIIELPALTLNSKKDNFQIGFIKNSDFVCLIVRSKKEGESIYGEIKHLNFNGCLINNSKKDLSGAHIPLKKINFNEDIKNFKKNLFNELGLIKIYSKEPGKEISKKPIVFKEEPSVKQVAEKIHKDYVGKFKMAKIYGISVKFQGQEVGLNHKLKDGDSIVIYIKK